MLPADVDDRAAARRGWVRRGAAVAAVALLAGLPSFRASALADGGCGALQTVPVEELLAVAPPTAYFDWLPPKVACTADGLDAAAQPCQRETTIRDDRVIGDASRYVLTSTASVDPDRTARDDLFAFRCVDGRIRRVLHDRFQPGAEIARAAAGEVVVKGSDQPPDASYQPDHVTFYWNATIRKYGSDPGSGRPPAAKKMACGRLRAAPAAELIAIADEGLSHGFGCYSVDPDAFPDQCEWKYSLTTDRMLGDARRLLVVFANHVGGSGSWSRVSVFGCLAGRVGTLFDQPDVEGGVADASPDALVLSEGYRSARDAGCCPSGERRTTYAWTARLGTYVVRDVRFGPRRPRPPVAPSPEPAATMGGAGAMLPDR
jgi:hypothetical protein